MRRISTVRPSSSFALLLAVRVLLLLVVLVARAPEAHASPWFGWNENTVEDRYADGELDGDDLLIGQAGPRAARRLGPTWLSIAAFGRVRGPTVREVGAAVLVGFPLERIVPGPRAAPPMITTLRTTLQETDAARAASAAAPHVPTVAPFTPLTPQLARSTVAAAWRASGLGDDNGHLDAMVARARLAALLPETRLRAMRTEDQTARVDSLPEEQRTTDSVGANLWLEARLTWRLDRLLYADDEPQVERMRQDRNEARARIAAKVLELLFRWQRGVLDARAAIAQSPEALEATLRAVESEIALDVITAGWFSAWRGDHEVPSSTVDLVKGAGH